jgi:hypothetical protein
MPTKKQSIEFRKQGQYPRKTRQYKRWRQKSPSLFIKTSFRTVPLNHTDYKGKKKGKAIVGKLKKTKKWAMQSILEER